MRITLEFEMNQPHDKAKMACVLRLVQFQGRNSVIFVGREPGNNRLWLDQTPIGNLMRVTIG